MFENHPALRTVGAAGPGPGTGITNTALPSRKFKFHVLQDGF